jgi:2-oxoglutarate ferredoxin oxidoreductase subunit alpha
LNRIKEMKNKKAEIRLMTGNEACAEAALAAGMRFFAGYPITPSSEIAEILADRLPRLGGVFIQMEDEIASIAAVVGASLGGVKAMTATSGPGFSLMQENIGYASMAEVPCVIVDVQRGGPSTGLPTLPSQGDVMQSRWGTHGDHPVIVLVPSTVRETFDWTIKAFNHAERFRVPVILLLDEIVGHVNEKIVMPETFEIIDRLRTDQSPDTYLPYRFTDSDIPMIADFGSGYRFNVTGLHHDEAGFPTNDPEKVDALNRRLNRKIERYQAEIIEFKEEYLDDARVCVVAYGSCARSARHAVREARAMGLRVGLFQPYVIWPFPAAALARLAGSIKTFIVPELNLGQIDHEVACAARTEVVRISRVDGTMIRPDEIIERIKDVSL